MTLTAAAVSALQRVALSGAVLAAALFALAPIPALAAEDDDPIPYPGEEPEKPKTQRGLRQLPVRSEKAKVDPPDPEGDPDEERDRGYDVEALASTDDPSAGFAAELLGGILFLDSSSGKWADTRPAFGVRGVWEFGRFLGGEFVRERLFIDALLLRTTLNGGTEQIQSQLGITGFSLAPALNFPLNDANSFSAYLQVGGGVAYQTSALLVDDTRYSISALKPLVQYGVGLRGRPAIADQGRLRLAFRIELTRFRRDYFDDLLLGASVGLGF